MPTYEYVCDKCGHAFEKFQSIKDEPLKRCPECRSRIRRVISGGAGVMFKGSGFYATDSRKGGASSKSDEKLPCGGEKPCKKDGTCPVAKD